MDNIHITCQYFLNHLLKDDELREQVEMISDAGFECLHAHSRFGLLTPYFSDAWWHALDVILEECRRHGIKFAIWDEDGYPSPTAGNRVVWADPGFVSQYLEPQIFSARGKTLFYQVIDGDDDLLACYAIYAEDCIEDITSSCGTVAPELQKPFIQYSAYTPVLKMGTPHIRARHGDRRWAVCFTPRSDCRVLAVKRKRGFGHLHSVDIMNEKAVDKFIEVTLEEYYKRYSSYFGNTIISTFLDEPSIDGTYPWTDKFDDRYCDMWGKSLIPDLPHLFCDISPESSIIRYRYRLTQKELICGNYLNKLRKWCREHGILSTGHLSRCENLSFCNGVLWPDELRCCRHLDIPCTDPLGNNIALRDTASYAVGLKAASSAAKLFGKRQAGSDALGVVGSEAAMRDLKFNLDFQMVMGITWFNIHGIDYSIDGLRKDEAPPSLFYQHTQWELMADLLNGTREVCRRLSASPSACRVAMLYPVSQFCCRDQAENRLIEEKLHLLADDLLTGGCDFDFIDELTLVELGADHISKKYDAFVVPEISFISRAAADELENYSGKLVCCGETAPVITGTRELWSSCADNAYSSPLNELPREDISGDGAENIFYRKCEDGTVYLFNRADREFRGTFNQIEVLLAPRSGELLEKAAAAAEEEKCEKVFSMELPHIWSFSAPENHVALQTARLELSDGTEKYIRLLDDNKSVDLPSGCCIQKCEFKFFAQGDFSLVKLVLEESSFSAPYICLVNGVPVPGFAPAAVYDCRNIVCGITDFIRQGSTATVNLLTFEFPDGMSGCFEPPRLYGNFSVKFRHTPNEMPYLEASPLSFDVPAGDLRSAGWGTFSGKVSYKQFFEWRGGFMRLDLGRVEDAAIVFIDGKKVCTLLHPPYRCDIGELVPGRHLIEVSVLNAPANRDRLSGLPFGLFGPVKLTRIIR